jgi:3-(3-hydroxy-phenyl)propionate hydroxylase
MNQPFRGSGQEVQSISFAYQPHPDAQAAQPVRHPVVVVGAGPVGLSLAIDLAQRGQRVVVLDNDHKLSSGSRAICFAKRTLDIWDRLGVGDVMVDKGVSWQVGKVFFNDRPIYQFNLLPEDGHARPAFINLQQYYAESFLVERALQCPEIDIRWDHKVADITQDDDGATLTVETPDGQHVLQADWVMACDGSRSTLRSLMGLETQGRVFKDRFLIADVKMEADFPTERWFWFNPPFHPGQSVLLHRQPDKVWRIDFQLGWDADPEAEKRPENIIPRVQALLGQDVAFELEWASVYTFACQRMAQFVHGRVLFAGDSAHGVSPFGARGANSGVQDADNLAWKLDRVLRGVSPAHLLATYGPEREYAADENILNSTRATDFISPKSEISRLFRDATLQLAKDHAFARKLVNSGRLSVPAVLRDSPLNTPDTDTFDTPVMPGAVLPDAPVKKGTTDSWLLRELGVNFTLITHGPAPQWVADWLQSLPSDDCKLLQLGVDVDDTQGLVAQRLDLQIGNAYLVRPDQHVCARWRVPTAADLQAAYHRATGALQ